MQDFVFKISKKNSAAGGETFSHTHPLRAHPPNAGVPPLHLGWLRPWTDTAVLSGRLTEKEI